VARIDGGMSVYGLMLLTVPPAAGVGLGYLCGGRLSGVRNLRLSAVWLLWLAAAVQAAQYLVAPLRHPAVLIVVFGLVLCWLGVNLPRWPLGLRIAGIAIAAGALTNGLAIALNGRMPYEPAAVEAVGLRPGLTTPKNAPADSSTRLAVLGDSIPVTPLKKVVSPGDVFIGAGTIALVAFAMRHRRDLVTPANRGR
jgi:hypothetical protein